MEKEEKDKIDQGEVFSPKTINAIIAYTASFTLNGIPPMVCESALLNLYSSVKRSGKLISVNRIIHNLHHKRA